MAEHLCRVLTPDNPYAFDPDCVVVGAGCNAVLENLMLCLTSPGDGVLVPAPYYAAFEFDLGARIGYAHHKY
jgi:aspartate/methionine/tyrosine aminotransferase